MNRAIFVALLASILLAAAPPGEPPPPQWPPAPQAARLKFSGEIAGPRMAGASRLGAFVRLLVGLDKAGEISSERLVRPTGLFVSSATVFVADPGRRAVLRYDEAGGRGAWWPRDAKIKLLSPVSVAAAPDGRLFVLDSLLKKVFILDASGNAAGELEGDPEGMGQPAALAVSGTRLYVSDVKKHRVAAYGLDGTFLQAFGRRGNGSGEFNFPTYLWFDKAADRLWVTDSGNFRLQWFSPDGRYLGSIGENGNRPGYLARPRGLAVDSDGHVFVSDAAFEAVQVFDEKNKFLLFVGRSGTAPGQFNMPGGVFIDGRDRVYVADTQNARVQVFQYLKEVRHE
ncbi:MAG: 6-bladed beta-propeller [Elusimicrobiota bacterium]